MINKESTIIDSRMGPAKIGTMCFSFFLFEFLFLDYFPMIHKAIKGTRFKTKNKILKKAIPA